MIICNLDALLKERHLKISKVAADTRISRTTLTALCNNSGKGVQFDTANMLCIYLGVGMDQLFTSLPYDISVEKCVAVSEDLPYPAWTVEIQLKYFDRKKTEFPILIAYVEYISFQINEHGDEDDYCEIHIEPPKNDYHERGEHGNSEEENALLISVFQSMPPIALQIVKDRIGKEITKNLSNARYYVTFPKELTSKE